MLTEELRCLDFFSQPTEDDDEDEEDWEKGTTPLIGR
jgi:hypothetical protein